MQDDEKGRARISERTKTDAGDRLVLLPRVAVRVLQGHRPRPAAGEALVFPSTGKPLSRQNVLQRWLYPIVDRCACGHKPHAGRDTDETGIKLEPTRISRRSADAPKSCKACGCQEYRARLPRVTFHGCGTAARLFSAIGISPRCNTPRPLKLRDHRGHLSDSPRGCLKAPREPPRRPFPWRPWGMALGVGGLKRRLHLERKTPKNLVFIRVLRVVPRPRVELGTPGFSDLCSTS
jgi:hypothetical protein